MCGIHKHTKIPPVNRPIPGRRFTQLMVDVVGPLPKSAKGMTHLLTIIDRTSRYAQAVPMPEATAESCCQAFLEGWVAQFGLCRNIISDNGNTFIAKLWTTMHVKLGALVSYTPLYHSASLGHLERQHRDIKTSLKAAPLEMGDKHGLNWPTVLPWILLGKRTAYQPDLRASPAEIVFKDTLLVPGDLAGAKLKEDSDLPHLLQRVRKNAAREPKQTTHHSQIQPFIPKDLQTATHLWTLIPEAKR